VSRNQKVEAFRWFIGKCLLAEVRGGDYAHAGSEEAIEKMFAVFQKDSKRTILDVGCGLGGTAHFVQEHGWGEVTGVDIDEEAIKYAQQKYPQVNFDISDASNAENLAKVLDTKTFDLIYIFHALCVFPKQIETLKALHHFAHKQTTLAIFEYTDLTDGNNPLQRNDDVAGCFNVHSLSRLNKMLKDAAWHLDENRTIDLTEDFARWYEDLLMNLQKMAKQIIEHYGQEYFDRAEMRYGEMLEAIKQKQLGGCILYATKIIF
jgi:ubiquinone/menaquinone biosynthesis C-methylase UbiE